MATPSFEELLAEARRVSENTAQSEQSRSRGQLLTTGISEFVKNLLLTPHGEKQTYSGYVDPAGYTAFKQPYSTGGNLIEMLAGGGQRPELPKDAFPLTQKQAAEGFMAQVLQSQKFLGSKALLEKKNLAREAAAKLNKRDLRGTQVMPKEISDAAYTALGADPIGRPLMTYDETSMAFKARNVDTVEFFRDIGIDIAANKDMFGAVPEETRAVIKSKREGRGTLFPAPRQTPVLPKQSAGLNMKFDTQAQVGEAFRNGLIDETTARAILKRDFNLD